jgi:type II secretory pathway pseudopilin PulG
MENLAVKKTRRILPAISSSFKFSLLEIVVVLAVIMLISTVAVNYIRKPPAAVVLANEQNALKEFFAAAALRAMRNGRRVTVKYRSDSGQPLLIADGILNDSDAGASDTARPVKHRFPGNITVEFAGSGTTAQRTVLSGLLFSMTERFPVPILFFHAVAEPLNSIFLNLPGA